MLKISISKFKAEWGPLRGVLNGLRPAVEAVILSFLILLPGTALEAQGRLFKAHAFDLTELEQGYEGIASNAVSDIYALNDSVILAATSNGLSISQDGGLSFQSYYSGEVGQGYGGVAAVTALGQHIWFSTVFDSAGVEEVTGTGSGISYSADGGLSWTHIPQMLDHPDSNVVRVFGQDIDALPVTVPIDNITFDLAVHVNSAGDTLLWAASFAGGTRVSRDLGQSWRRVVLPPDDERTLDENTVMDFDYTPVTREDLGLAGNYNHESFSVLAYGDTIVVGTAAGINISQDCGRTWTKYNHQSDGISGNFVVDLHLAEDGTVYAACLPALGSSEIQGLSYSRRGVKGARVWEHSLDNVRLYSVGSAGDRIYAGSRDGGWLSRDGWNWIQMNYPMDLQTGNQLYSDEIYALVPDLSGRVWAGTRDGLAYTLNDGLDWTLIRRTAGLGRSSDILCSAYPNPFSPTRMNVLQGTGHVRIFIDFPAAGEAEVQVFDFSMSPVIRLARDAMVSSAAYEFVWDGRNNLGDLCANGVYFIRVLHKDDNGKQRVGWTKLIILE